MYPQRKVLLIVILAFVAMNAWCLTVVRRLYGEMATQEPGIRYSSLSKAKTVRLADGSQPLLQLGAPKRLSIVYFYTPFDCPQAIEELGELEVLHEESPALDIRAVAFFESPQEVKESVKRFGLTYPVYPDQDGRLKKMLAPPQTPWKIVIGPTGYPVMAEDPPSITPEEKKAFHFRMNYLLRQFEHTQNTH